MAQAEGDANRFSSVLTEYQKAPTVTRDRLYIDTMQQIYSNVSKVMVDVRNGANLLYLPLDKLLQQSGVAPGNAVAAPAVEPPATPSNGTVDVRSRDGQRERGRDRDGR